MTRISARAVALFIVLAIALAWLVALPLWLGGGLTSPLATFVLSAMMFTPAAAVVIVLVVLRPIPRGERLRTLGMWPLRPAKRVIGMSVLGLFLPIVVVLASIGIAVAFGWARLDLVGLSGFAEVLEASVPPGVTLPPIWIVALSQLVSIPLAAMTVNAIAAFSEEVGWRGFLLPALRPWGTAAALGVSGAIWGLWHAPVILLGYNFGRTHLSGVLLMVVGCIAWGVLFGWLRLRSGSLWPAVFGHGSLNASAGLLTMFSAAGVDLDPALVSPLGVAGWIALALVVLVLVVAGQFRAQPELAPRVAPEEPSGAAEPG